MIMADISVFIFHPSGRVCEGVKWIEKNQLGIEVILKEKNCATAMICEGIKFIEKKFRPKLCYVKGSNLLKKIGQVLRLY